MKKFFNWGIAKISDIITNRFYLKLSFLVVCLFSAIPYVHSYIGRYTKILLVWAFIILVYDLFKKRLMFKDKLTFLLILFLLSYGITVFLYGRLELVGNLSHICYMAVFFLIFFVIDRDLTVQEVKNQLKILFRVFLSITFVFSVVSFFTFCIWLQHYYSTPAGDSMFGVFDNRLWGLYNPNVGGMLNMISCALCSLSLFRQKKIITKVFTIINMTLQFICLVLTQSRSSWYNMMFFAAVFTFFVLSKPVGRYLKNKIHLLSPLIRAAAALLVVFVLIAINAPIRNIAILIPTTFQSSISKDLTNELVSKTPPPASLIRLEQEENRPGGFLTGRIDLWKGGLEAFKQSPILGVSYKAMNDLVRPYVDIQWHFTLVGGGLHNIYLTVLVSAGAIGFSILAVFLILSLIRILKAVIKQWHSPNFLFMSLVIIILCFLAADMVEAKTLFTASVFSVFFWILYGYAMYFSQKINEDTIKNQNVGDN